LFVFVIITNNAFNQQLADEVSSKLSEADQKKITKADNLVMKGDLQLSKSGYPGDKQFLEMLDMGETKELKKFAGERLDAAGNYKDANYGKFQIYEKNINEFWKKFDGNKTALDNIKIAETKAIQQFNDAITIRKSADKNSKLTEKLTLISEAETKEKEALTMLQKVLYVYLNYPATYDQSWFEAASTVKKEAEPVKKEGNVTYYEPTPIVTPTPTLISTPETKVKPDTVVKKETVSLPKKDTENIPGDSSLYSMVNVGEDQIDRFNSFLQKKYPNSYESYIIDFQNIDYSNLQSLRNAWYQYRFGVTTDSSGLIADRPVKDEAIQKDTIQQIIAQDLSKETKQSTVLADNPPVTKKVLNKTVTADGKTVYTVTEKIIETKPALTSTEKTIEKPVITGTEKTTTRKQKKPVELTETKVPVTKETIESTSEPIAKGFLFKVQVAASRISLNESLLNGIYQGSEKITETLEDDWYKYTIGSYNTYKQARQLRDNTNVPGVFVVAYLNGKRIKITPAVVSKKSIPETENIDGIQPEKIEFRIQLLASKESLGAETLKNIYNGPITIDTIEEDGWLKYSLMAGNKLSDALDLLKSVNVPGSFIVAYYNNQKLNLRTAIKLTKNN
jgi:hypothetical protein